MLALLKFEVNDDYSLYDGELFYDLDIYLFQPMETNGPTFNFRPRSSKAATLPLSAEVETYLHLLLLMYLIDNKKYQEVSAANLKLANKFHSTNLGVCCSQLILVTNL